jgi:Methyltransferase domain
LHHRTEYYEAVGSYSTLEQNPAPVTGGRVPNPPFFINTFSLPKRDSIQALTDQQELKNMGKQNKKHWETVYETKNPDQVSWTQEVPKTSLDFIHSFGLTKTAKIIDIGGGDSKLVDYLLDEGFENITVLDISVKALEKSQKRLGDKAIKVNWVVSDITEFEPTTTFDVWHDRATFHFLTTAEQVEKYMTTARNSVNGYLTIGTFSENGPTKCSGLEIKQYSEENLTTELKNGFDKIRCVTEDHTTPFDTTQNFLFCSFKRQKNGRMVNKGLPKRGLR